MFCIVVSVDFFLEPLNCFVPVKEALALCPQIDEDSNVVVDGDVVDKPIQANNKHKISQPDAHFAEPIEFVPIHGRRRQEHRHAPKKHGDSGGEKEGGRGDGEPVADAMRTFQTHIAEPAKMDRRQDGDDS